MAYTRKKSESGLNCTYLPKSYKVNKIIRRDRRYNSEEKAVGHIYVCLMSDGETLKIADNDENVFLVDEFLEKEIGK